MQTKAIISSLLAAGLACAQSDVVQLRVPPPVPGDPATPRVMYFNPSAQAHVGAMEFVRSEFGSAATVKGAPYTAEAVTESVQVLQDGNRIVHKDSVTLARDYEGRTRRDMTMPLIPGMNANDVPKFSFVFDPTTNTSYTLNHNTRTATKTNGRGFSFAFSTSGAPGAEARGAVKSVMAGTVASGEAQVVHKIERSEAVEGSAAGGGVMATAALGLRTGGNNAKTEKLGNQTMEGVLVEGTRTVTTIPAGEIGNERPIEIVSERWYSPELQMVVMSKHVDPRQGETTYRLTNLRRGEPMKSLFEVPSGYTTEPTMQPFRIQRDPKPAAKE